MKQYKDNNNNNKTPNQPKTQQNPVTVFSDKGLLFSSACLQHCCIYPVCTCLPAPQRSHRVAGAMREDSQQPGMQLDSPADQRGMEERHCVIIFTHLKGEIYSLTVACFQKFTHILTCFHISMCVSLFLIPDPILTKYKLLYEGQNGQLSCVTTNRDDDSFKNSYRLPKN